MLSTTFQMIVPNAFSPEGGQSVAFKNFTIDKGSIFEQIRETSTRSSRSLFFQHLKIMLVSEELLKTPHQLTKLIDLLLRDDESRRNIKVIITKGRSKKYLAMKPPIEKVPSLYIEELSKNSK